jgi:hypothetical protein
VNTQTGTINIPVSSDEQWNKSVQRYDSLWLSAIINILAIKNDESDDKL